MAGRKKKAARKSAKRKTKSVARKSKRVAKKSTRRKTAARTAQARKTKAAKRPARKKKATGELGEGNYKASRRFRKSEEAFVERNRQNIPAMGREAEAALEGREGPALIEAENEARSRAAE